MEFFSKFKNVFFILVGIFIVILFRMSMDYTSTNTFCESCHIHPQATTSWRLGAHYDNSSGVLVGCVECHLPPDGTAYLSVPDSNDFDKKTAEPFTLEFYILIPDSTHATNEYIYAQASNNTNTTDIFSILLSFININALGLVSYQ